MTVWAARLAAVIATILIGVIAYCAPQAEASPGMERYVDPVNGWSISYPVGWRVDGSNPSFVQIHDPQNQALVGVRVWPTDLPLNAFVDQQLASDQEHQSGVTNVVKGRQLGVLPNGNPYVQVGVAREPGGRSLQIYVLKGGRAFGVNAEASAAAWEGFNADFERIVQSFAPPA